MIRTLLIEDEPQSREFIKKLVHDTAPFIEVVGEAGHVEQAVEMIKETRPQLLIVDIQLYGRSAFDIFKEIDDYDFHLVFITAFEHFAIPAIKLSAVDYILKPISPLEFKEAMQKVAKRAGIEHPAKDIPPKEASGIKYDKLIISDHKEIHIIRHSDVVYLEADGNYTHAILDSGKKITSSRPISDYENLLLSAGFYRVHKSYLVNLQHVTKYIKGRGGEIVMDNGDTVFVSSRKKDEFLTLISGE